MTIYIFVMYFIKIIFLCGFVLLNITAFVNIILAEFTNNVQVLVKESAKLKNGSIVFKSAIKQNSDDFATFLSLTNVIIDRSMFIDFVINEFIDNKERFIITSPSRWGKTTLQSMLHFFFSIQLDNNSKQICQSETTAYKYFHSGEIEVNGIKHKFSPSPMLFTKTKYTDKLNKHLAAHPIITLDLHSLYGKGCYDLEDFKELLNDLILSQYILHETILESICSEEGKRNIKYLCYSREQALKMQIHPQRNLKTLATLLYNAYNGKEIILLIDEYDAIPLENYIATEQNMHNTHKRLQADPRVVKFYQTFMLDFMKETTGSKTLYLFVYITGILPISFDGMSSTNIKYKNYIPSELTPFFGIDNKTADYLMNLARFDNERKEQIRSTCDNYESSNFPEVTFYNPFSLLEFLHGTEENYPWCEKSRTRFLSTTILPENINAIYELTLLVGQHCIEYSNKFKRGFTFSQLEELGRQLLKWEENPTKQNFLTYLLCVGIVTLSTTDKYDSEALLLQPVCKTTCVRIANEENRKIIETQLSTRSYQEFDVKNTSEILAQIVYNPKISLSTFQMKVQSLLKYSDDTKHLIHGSELYYHAIFFCDIVRYLGRKYNYKYLLDYKFIGLKDNKTPDIVIYNNSHAAIFEIKYNNKPPLISDARQGQLREYGLLFHNKYPECQNLRLILIHIEETEQRNIMVEITEVPPITSKEGFIQLKKDYENYIAKKSYKKENPDMVKQEMEDQKQIPYPKQQEPNVEDHEQLDKGKIPCPDTVNPQVKDMSPTGGLSTSKPESRLEERKPLDPPSENDSDIEKNTSNMKIDQPSDKADNSPSIKEIFAPLEDNMNTYAKRYPLSFQKLIAFVSAVTDNKQAVSIAKTFTNDLKGLQITLKENRRFLKDRKMKTKFTKIINQLNAKLHSSTNQ